MSHHRVNGMTHGNISDLVRQVTKWRDEIAEN
jgi:hypothetical protein